jgi:hypothetical protein
MEFTEEIAKKADAILAKASPSHRFVSVDTDNESYNDNLIISALFQEHDCGKLWSRETFRVDIAGISLYQTGGFVGMLEKQKIDEERARRLDELTQKQIRAAKREPWLIGWSILTTIATIVLSILQFCL